MIKCYFCKNHLDVNNFYKDKSRSSGYSSICKKCNPIRNKERYKSSSYFDSNGNVFYVYAHLNSDDEIVYIGKGCFGRAWDCKGRSGSHSLWMNNNIHNNTNFVKILESRLLSSDALDIERELIKSINPIFNKNLKGDIEG